MYKRLRAKVKVEPRLILTLARDFSYIASILCIHVKNCATGKLNTQRKYFYQLSSSHANKLCPSLIHSCIKMFSYRLSLQLGTRTPSLQNKSIVVLVHSEPDMPCL